MEVVKMVSFFLNMGSVKIDNLNALTALADFAKKTRMDKGLSLDEVELRSGGGITNGYISKIENGKTGNVTLPRLRALAVGLGVDPSIVIAIANGKALKDLPEFVESEFAIMAFGYGNAKMKKSKNLPRIETLKELLKREIDEAQGEAEDEKRRPVPTYGSSNFQVTSEKNSA